MNKIRLMMMAFITSTTIVAQDVPKFGLKGGINFATITNSASANYDFKVGFHFGGLAHVHITPSFSLQPEIMYSTQGTKYQSGEKLLLNYINVPVLLQYNFDDGFRLQGGPQVGFLTEAKRKIGDVEFDAVNDYKTIDFSIPLGFSYLGYSGFGVDTRYNIGVSNIRDVSNSYKIRNSVIQLGIFYLFDHKHKTQTSRKRRR